MSNDTSIGKIIRFLAEVKSEICIDKPQSVGRCGYIAAMANFDDAIKKLLEQQTEIENLENYLSIEKEENAEYHKRYGELENEQSSIDIDSAEMV